MSENNKEFIYIADPMCSWCWGFSPVIGALKGRFGDAMDFTLVVGGLRVGTEAPFTDHLKQNVLHHWHEVHDMTGQPFGFEFNLPDDFKYDTEPSCRAAVTVRKLRPDSEFEYFDTLHEAFYAQNRDVTNPDILAELAEPLGIDATEFLETFNAKDTKQETFDDFGKAFEYGVQGFPTAVLKDERGPKLLTTGYQHIGQLAPLVENWIAQGEEQAAT